MITGGLHMSELTEEERIEVLEAALGASQQRNHNQSDWIQKLTAAVARLLRARGESISDIDAADPYSMLAAAERVAPSVGAASSSEAEKSSL